MAEAIHLKKDSAAGKESEAEALPEFRSSDAKKDARFDQHQDEGGKSETRERSKAGMKPTAAAGDELGLEDADGFDQREAEGPKDRGQREHSHGLEMQLLFPGHGFGTPGEAPGRTAGAAVLPESRAGGAE